MTVVTSVRHRSTRILTNDPFDFFGIKMPGYWRNIKSIEIIRSSIVLDEETGCMNWIGSKNQHGYGQFSSYCHKKKKSFVQRVHRFLTKQKAGRELSSHEFSCHTCDNPACVNPAHLYIGSAMDNSKDMMKRKGHYLAIDPTRSVRSKFTPEQVKEIRLEHKQGGITHADLGRKYGIDSSVMSKIVRGLRYKHVK